ncbi:LysM peptidoglycan-binding domain-containing protein [Arthrobacter sp. NPDC056493]|uniref:LysM peptidoglycan-binding domain-containing protein n=1 Tax=Arthrobacter sp. NPDC056493 TaxID=3345839 RepID=UPI00366EB12A
MGEEVRRPVRAEAALAFVILGLGVFLALTGAGIVDHWMRSAARQQALLFDDLLGLLALAAGLTVIAWWLLSLATAFASALLERTGHHAAARATGRFSPVFMRRLALAAVGIQLLGAPLAQADELPAAALSASNGTSLSAAWAPLAERPDLPASNSADSSGTERPGGTEGTGVTEGTVAGGSEHQPQWKPRVPVAQPGLVSPLPARATAEPATARREVPVRAGESLWTIAARELGPGASEVEVAARWPLWYQANRNVIGADPNVLLPGQLLSPPPPP